MLKSNIQLKESKIRSENPNNISFMCGTNEILRLDSNGDIYVKGELTDNNLDVVEGLKHFLRCHKYNIK